MLAGIFPLRAAYINFVALIIKIVIQSTLALRKRNYNGHPDDSFIG